jgi:hypothetical protein
MGTSESRKLIIKINLLNERITLMRWWSFTFFTITW